MSINISETIVKLKRAGGQNIRVVPMPGQSINEGMHQIEIKEGDIWTTLVTGIKKKMAEDMVQQALNKVLLG